MSEKKRKMRKIEFRGKIKHDNCPKGEPGTWIYGDIHTHEDPKCVWVDSWHIFPETGGQFVGLDKKQKKTYEGDIAEYGPEKYRYLVEWDEKECGFILRCTTEKKLILKGAMLRQAIVIGNRFDNPELLKETAQ
jgi:hypothetical protein